MKLGSMKIQDEGGIMRCIFLLTLATAVSCQDVKCPFKYVYHFGDGFLDIGNSIHVDPKAPNPARLPPYGMTYPGWPSGRWSDGLVLFDNEAVDLGLPNIVPYLTSLASTTNDGVMFSAARSPVLPFAFFKGKGIDIPSYAVPLHTQMRWFRTYLKSVCSTKKECAARLANSFVVLGDCEGNDIGYALTQGKSIAQVKTYVPLIVREQINVARELIELGATRVTIPGSGPLGCFPYILTALFTHDRDGTAYDELGCLNSVNKLILHKNHVLEKAVKNLQAEFPYLTIGYAGDVFNAVRSIINDSSVIGPDGINKALKSCCGIGGRYNYDSNRFCGSPGVPVCPNPNEYIFWDGIHLTQQGFYRLEPILSWPAIPSLCNETTSVESSPLSTSFELQSNSIK